MAIPHFVNLIDRHLGVFFFFFGTAIYHATMDICVHVFMRTHEWNSCVTVLRKYKTIFQNDYAFYLHNKYTFVFQLTDKT